MARYGVGPDDGRVAELLRKGYWTLADLVEAAGLPPQPVHALVYALYITEALDIKAAAEVPRLRKRTDTPLPPNATARDGGALRECRARYKMPSQVTPMPLSRSQRPSGAASDASSAQMPSGAFKCPVAAARRRRSGCACRRRRA